MAATVQHNKAAQQLLMGFPEQGPLTWQTLTPVLEGIIRALPLTLSAEGLDVQEIPGGFHLKQ